ncbi:trypsin-like serine protease [Nonomuraea longispora]|uniref:Trypsin-like serine protease n=1 Tax=Nonomuraea longispora TaxID=1848320 RepID=A0A4R4NJG4_9ACTN|nr:trypsin-like serine protease [Nonomuraea longispora]TDC09239.1 trypsin-like serine protease [Nonomuraea longispora]
MIPRARHVALAALSSALLVLPALTGIADAARDSKVYAVPLATTQADVKRVAEHWKPDRLKVADNYSPATPETKAAPTSQPVTPTDQRNPVAAIRRSLAAQNVAAVMPRKGKSATTMGKVYFRFGDKEYWCSASAVAAKNRSVVATAAHCAYDSRQARAADSWIFVPSGEASGGIYVGAAISMHEDWSGKGDYDYDYAFVTVHRGFTWTKKNGTYVMKDIGRLQDNVGGQGLSLNKKPSAYSPISFGYPAGMQPDRSHPFNGKSLRSCERTVTQWAAVAPAFDLQKGVQLQPCDFSHGASGGPWLIGWNENRGLGTLVGVNSLTWNRDAQGWYDAVSSPYFDTTTGEVYRHASSVRTISRIG